MDKFLQIAGLVFAVLAVVLAIWAIGTAPSGSLIALPVAGWAATTIVGGVIIAAFGSMLGHLKAIRAHSERQTFILEESRNHSSPQQPHALPRGEHAGQKPDLSQIKLRFTDR